MYQKGYFNDNNVLLYVPRSNEPTYQQIFEVLVSE